MKKICFCPKSLGWIVKHLVPSARPKFFKMVPKNILLPGRDFFLDMEDMFGFKRNKRKAKTKRTKSKKRRTAKQRAATRRLVAFNKRRRR